MGKKKKLKSGAEGQVKSPSSNRDYSSLRGGIKCTIDMDNDPQCPHCHVVFKRVQFASHAIPTDGWRSRGIPVKLFPCGHNIQPWELGLFNIVITGRHEL